MARVAHARGSEGTRTGFDYDWTLLFLLLGGIIENQNSASSSSHKAPFAFGRDGVRILIFDDPAEQERGHRP
jgi:hypothetical protein